MSTLLKPLKVNERPIYVVLEPTTVCNLKCIMCKRDKFVKNPKHMIFEEFKEIMDKVEPLKITLSGLGEPLINPEIDKMIRYAKEKGASIASVTNFVKPTIPLKDLVESKIDLLEISIDGATKETYHKIRGADYFEKIMENIKKTIIIKKNLKVKKPYFRFQFVILEKNVSEIPKVVSLASELGINAVYFKPLFLSGISERHDELVGNLSQDEVDNNVLEGIEIAKATHVRTNLRDLKKNIMPEYWKLFYLENKDIRQNLRKCPYPWFSVYITVDGGMRPCCFFTSVSDSIESILGEDLSEIWNSNKFQNFRKALRENKPPHSRCKECIPESIWELILSYKDILPGWLFS